MTNKFIHLLIGEFTRLKKYNVILVNLLVTAIWLLALYFIEDNNLFNSMLPFILMIDTTMMASLFIGATMFFEKSEQTIATLLVTPSSHHMHIWAKVVANTVHMLFGSILIVLIFYFVRQVEINFFYLLVALLLTTIFHSILGFVFSYLSKEFTSMLMVMMAYSLLFMIPTILYNFNIIFVGDVYKYILILSPSQAALYLLESAVNGVFKLESVLAIAALVLYSVLLYVLVVAPKYKSYTIKQSGV